MELMSWSCGEKDFAELNKQTNESKLVRTSCINSDLSG